MREHHTCFLGADAERLCKYWAGAEHVDAPGCTELIQESEHRRGVVFIHTVIYMGFVKCCVPLSFPLASQDKIQQSQPANLLHCDLPAPWSDIHVHSL